MKLRYKLNLQHFAEEPPKAASQAGLVEPEAKEPEPPKEPGAKEPEPPKEPEPKAASQAGLVEPPKEPEPSSRKYASAEEVEALTNLVKLHGETTKASHQVLEQLREELRETQEELKETTVLLQNLIGQMDDHGDKIVQSAAALVRLHKEQQRKTGA